MINDGKIGVIFSNDLRNDDTLTQRKLYTRLELKSSELLNYEFNFNDPLYEYVNNGKITLQNTDEINIFNKFNIELDILDPQFNDIVQYHAEIDESIIDRIMNNNLLIGINREIVIIWILGLLINGKYDIEDRYKFEIFNENGNYYWNIRIFNNGLFKILTKITLNKVEVNLDDVLLKDLEYFYNENKLFKSQERNWELEKEKFSQNIFLIKEKEQLNKLKDSVRKMRMQISEYFVPLVNSLLKENKLLKGDTGDVIFSSKKRKNDIEEMKQEIFKEMEIGINNNNNEDDEDDGGKKDKFLELARKEKNKRRKLEKVENEKVEEVKPKEHVKETIFENNSNDLEDDIVFLNKREHHSITETQSDFITANCEVNESIQLITLENDTQIDDDEDDNDDQNEDQNEDLDQETDISDYLIEENIESDEKTDYSTEVSSSGNEFD